MAVVELVMPKMGESVMEGTILTWLKEVGDVIEEDESVLEVATDKVDTEIPSTTAGVLQKILANDGDVVPVGAPIAVIQTEGDDVGFPEPTEKDSVDKANEILNEAKELVSTPEISEKIEKKGLTDRFYSPLVRNMAKEEKISFDELEKVPGTGKDNRVTKRDMIAYLETRKKSTSVRANGQAPKPMPVSIDGGDEIIEMDRMRKMIAERMVASKAISPHVTSFVEADMTRVVKWRAKMKSVFMEQAGQSLTYTPIIIEAIVNAIKDFPMINIQVDGDRIIRKKSINIGLAVALPTGNLIVPVIHGADQLNLLGLTKAVNDLARRARENQLKPDELSGGTFTVSNVGSFGNVMGTPIIMQPQVAIMALGAIQKKPAVIETPDGDLIGIRHKMFLSHSYDHRVVDGALGGQLVRKVADYLEQFDVDRGI